MLRLLHGRIEGGLSVSGFSKLVQGDMASVEERVRESLKERGFGVLTEIDVSATLKAKINVDRSPLKILGACNPTFANKALEADPDMALVMPCNVVLSQEADGILVRAIDPASLVSTEDMKILAKEAGDALSEAVSVL